MPLFTSLFTLNPEVDKFNSLYRNDVQVECEVFDEKDFDLKSTYYFTGVRYNEKIDKMRSRILELFNSNDVEVKLSDEVVIQSYKLMDKMYPSTLEVLNVDDFYTTPYGTLIIDWEKDSDNVFSLEIGAKRFGYFIEVDGIDVKQVDSESIDDYSIIELSKDLTQFLSQDA